MALTPHAEAEWAEADAYSPGGAFVFRARWPANVDLGDDAILGDAAWGVEEGGMGRGLAGAPQVSARGGWPRPQRPSVAASEFLTNSGHLPSIAMQFSQSPDYLRSTDP